MSRPDDHGGTAMEQPSEDDTGRLYVLAVDPGRITGLAWMWIDRGEFDPGELFTQQDSYTPGQLHRAIVQGEPDVLIYESFEYRPYLHGRAIDMYGKELVGVIELYLEEHPDCKGYKQEPSIQSRWKRQTLLKLNLWKKGKAHSHEMEALAHLLHWFEFGAGNKYLSHKKGNTLLFG